jgi:aspartate carbamoyltransferase regulatory subunit
VILSSLQLKNILSNGIALNLESEEEEQHYIIKMQEYFVEETEFTAYLRERCS